MKPYIEWTKEELVAEKARLEQEFAEVKAKGLNLNISRGKPAAAQLDLTEGMLTVLSKNEDCLEALRKKYWDARHNCFVYIIGENQETVRCSDDGEPSGTAGRPMLDVVQGAGLRNVLVVVTRYFGGTLLGTGGLVRAYSQAVQEGLANSVLIDEICGVRLLIETDYNGIGKIQYLLGQRGIPILESEYTDQVKIRVLVPKTEVDRLCAEITEGTNGKAKLEKEEELYFAQNDGELIFGDELTQYKNLEAEELG